ncbi:hypothetical protein FRC04_005742 [Tulasnella sp. 424]|nr:hypothetical protein FRC04_005742 [Tulasnella sp. 424]
MSSQVQQPIAIAKPDPKEPALKGVEGDLPLILDELTARTNSTIQVITDLQLPESNPKAQGLLPTVRNVEDSIQKVGQAMKDGGLCYVFLAGDTDQDSPESAYMPLASGERLDGKDLTAWLEAAGSNGGTFMVIADVGFAASLIQLQFVCDVNDGQLSWSKSKSSEKEGRGKTAQVVALLATNYNQGAGTIIQDKEPYLGWHGLFTWALFNFVRSKQRDIEANPMFY